MCLEECAPEDVLTKAAMVKESEDLWIFVAPGALDERSRPMRVIPLAPQVVEFRIPEPVAAGVTEIKPKSKLEVSVVEVKIPAPAPEDDPLLCELELQAPTVVQSAPKVTQQIAEVPAYRDVGRGGRAGGHRAADCRGDARHRGAGGSQEG